MLQTSLKQCQNFAEKCNTASHYTLTD